MADLITAARAKYNINQSSFTSAEDTTISALVTAVSKAVKKHCQREFDQQTFDELYHGTNTSRLLLRHTPILSVSRVAYGPTTVLRLTNTGSSNQRATVAVTSTGLTLARVASGNTSTDTSVTFAANVTLNAVKTAVDALGNGWAATVISPYGLRASADLRAVQGALHAKDVFADLKLHVEELSDYEVDAAHGWLLRVAGGHPAFGDFDGPPVWFGSSNYWRVVYSAGYATVPEDVQEAAAEWTASLFWLGKRDAGLLRETVAEGRGQTFVQGMPRHVRQLLALYRDHKLV